MSTIEKKPKWMTSPKSTPNQAVTPKQQSKLVIKFSAASAVVLLMCAILNWYWSIEPALFDVTEKAIERRALANTDASSSEKFAPGYIFSNTLAQIGHTLLNKNGGYLSNDATVPSIMMDNMPTWEFGALIMLRDATSALRNHFGRSQSQSKENPDLAMAEPLFYFDSASWLIPPTEGEYQKGIDRLRNYMDDLQSDSPQAHFYARADNLSQYLQVVEKRMGDYSHRLSASSIQKHQYSLDTGKVVVTKTPWMEVDDIFYEVRGATWALYHIFRAIDVEFQPTLAGKTALATLRQITHELQDAQATTLSPLILNGNGYGVFANYSLTMANFITRANAATLDLRNLLLQG